MSWNKKPEIKKFFINTIYRQPSENTENFENYFGKSLEKPKPKITYLLGDFNLNLLDYDTNFEVQSYCNTAFSHNFIPIINKPTLVTNHNATITDDILTNSCDSKNRYQDIRGWYFRSFSNLFHLQINKC